ncbi:MAG: nucleoside monophosphate kinase [Verrucomicrobia bacterium]|nr:nucleoside monophosphate kinase [Verrucomicrobiota bacterium]
MNLSIIGTKGAGKGTQLKRLTADFNLLSFSPGDLFRAGVRQRTGLGRLAEKYVQSGQLVPDDIVDGLVTEWLSTVSPEQGIAFDGFPRTRTQTFFLEETFREMGRKLDVVLFLEVATETVMQRLFSRRVCSVCELEFHLTSHPFETCPLKKCEGQHLRQLEQDDPDVIRILTNDFRSSIGPLLDYYQQTSRLIRINGEGEVEQVHAAIIEALSAFR